MQSYLRHPLLLTASFQSVAKIQQKYLISCSKQDTQVCGIDTHIVVSTASMASRDAYVPVYPLPH